MYLFSFPLFLLQSILLCSLLTQASAINLKCELVPGKPQNCVFTGNSSDNSSISWDKHENHHVIKSIKIVDIRLTDKTPSDIFRAYEELEELDVSKTKLESLLPLPKAKHLKSFNANNNKIKKLEAKIFIESLNLQVIQFNENQINDVNEKTFYGLIFLKSLFLKSNQIQTIMNNTFQPLSKLSKIDLSENKIVKIMERIFWNNHNMEEILLKKNLLNIMVPGIFDGLTLLKTIDLEFNKCVNATMNDAKLPAFKNNLLICFNNYNLEDANKQRQKINSLSTLDADTRHNFNNFKNSTDEQISKWSIEIWTVFICFAVVFIVVIIGTIATIVVVARLISNLPTSQVDKQEVDELLADNDDESFDDEIDDDIEKNEKKVNPQSELYRLKELSKKDEPELIEEEEEDDEIYDVVGTGENYCANEGYYA